MTTVKELIEMLKKFPEDCQVLGHPKTPQTPLLWPHLIIEKDGATLGQLFLDYYVCSHPNKV